MTCLICDTPTQKTEEWLDNCPSCNFKQSTLKSGAGRGVDGLETLRKQNFQTIIERLASHIDLTKAKCLEVGCAEGWFLEAMTAIGADISAVEASDQALERQKEGYNVIHGFFPDALPTSQKYDLIIFNDVFEHLPDPVASLKKCEEFLNPNGLLIINLPNSNGIFYRLSAVLKTIGMRTPFDRLWQKDLPSPHMTYFSNDNMPSFTSKYSRLSKIDLFYLPSIVKTGLHDRIKASYRGVSGNIIYTGLLGLLPFMRALPQDIMVFVFRKA